MAAGSSATLTPCMLRTGAHSRQVHGAFQRAVLQDKTNVQNKQQSCRCFSGAPTKHLWVERFSLSDGTAQSHQRFISSRSCNETSMPLFRLNKHTPRAHCAQSSIQVPAAAAASSSSSYTNLLTVVTCRDIQAGEQLLVCKCVCRGVCVCVCVCVCVFVYGSFELFVYILCACRVCAEFGFILRG